MGCQVSCAIISDRPFNRPYGLYGAQARTTELPLRLQNSRTATAQRKRTPQTLAHPPGSPPTRATRTGAQCAHLRVPSLVVAPPSGRPTWLAARHKPAERLHTTAQLVDQQKQRGHQAQHRRRKRQPGRHPREPWLPIRTTARVFPGYTRTIPAHPGHHLLPT
jgi:hypothetical protein